MKGEFVSYEVDRLDHVVHAETKKPYTMFEDFPTGKGRIFETRAVCTIEPQTLKKLKAKGIAAIRGEMAMIGELELADKIIFHDRSR